MKDKEMTAYCGLCCTTCPIHLATIETDINKKNEMKSDIVRILHEQYEQDLRIEDIADCDGCLAESSHIYPSCNRCIIRKCARQKQLTNCAYCRDYPCSRLSLQFKSEPQTREHLDEIHRRIINTERA